MLLVEKQSGIAIVQFSGDYVSTFDVKGKRCLQVEPEALTMISEQAMIDIAHLLRPAHLQVQRIFSLFLFLHYYIICTLYKAQVN